MGCRPFFRRGRVSGGRHIKILNSPVCDSRVHSKAGLLLVSSLTHTDRSLTAGVTCTFYILLSTPCLTDTQDYPLYTPFAVCSF